MFLFIEGLFNNKVFIAAVSAWGAAQFLKLLITFLINKELKLERFHGSGGMPSSHTATIIAAASAIGHIEGWTSSIFALSVIMSFIVMYDASGVRRSVGKQAKLLNEIITDLYKTRHLEEERLKELIGHKPTEVVVGALLGIFIANLIV